jgi:hypothetical protein
MTANDPSDQQWLTSAGMRVVILYGQSQEVNADQQIWKGNQKPPPNEVTCTCGISQKLRLSAAQEITQESMHVRS